jgi:uncharacterized protein (TIGR03086 family)
MDNPMDHRISDLLAAAAARAEPVERGVDDDRLGAGTPCAEYDVRGLLNHLFHVVVEFQKPAAKGDVDFTSTPGRVAGDWRARFAEECARLVRAWAAPGAEEGTADAMDLPARTLGSLALLDLTVHAWDLARATGQDFVPDAEGVRVLESVVARMGPNARRMKVFGEPLPVPEGATPLEALLASTGRDPYWSPAAGR